MGAFQIQIAFVFLGQPRNQETKTVYSLSHTLKGRLEPLEKDIHEILVSKREDRL